MSHCLYGLDADLVMLALMSHEQKFAILREALHFDRGEVSEWDARWKLEERQNEFVLVHIGVLREYLHCEFSPHFAHIRQLGSAGVGADDVALAVVDHGACL